jgi:hypothetical protein
MPSLLNTLTAIVAFIGVSYSAECEQSSSFLCVEAGGSLGRVEEYWNARGDYCGNDRWRTESCYTYKPRNSPAIYIQNSNPGVGDRNLCWSALENIIGRT